MAASSSTSRETQVTSSLVTGQGMMPLSSHTRNPVSAKADLTNCVTLHQRFFQSVGKSCESMDCNLLIAYWIMAGYLNPVESVQKAYEKGNRILVELIQQGFLKYIPSARDEDVNKVLCPTDSNLNCCRHLGHCDMQNLDYSAYLLSLNQAEKVTLTDGVLKDEKGSFILVDGDQLSRLAVGSFNRLEYLAYFNSNWNEDSEKHLKRLLGNANHPSVLLIRGRGLSEFEFSFENLKTLTVLEISDSRLRHVPEAIFTELIQLQCLTLSRLPDWQLPEDSFSNLKQLRCLILTHCSRLETLPSLRGLGNLEVLELSYCKSLSRLPFYTISSPKLYRLVLSWTALTRIPPLGSVNTTKHSSRLQLLDLNFAYKLQEVDLSQHNDLEVLDLSYTNISSIDSVSDKVHLRELILCGCLHLEVLPVMEKLESLAVLDVSGCEQLGCLPDLSNQRKLEALDLSETQVKCLPPFANPSLLRKLSLKGLKLDSLETLCSLSSLLNLDLCGVEISSLGDFKVDFLRSLERLQTLNLSRTSVAELPALACHVSLKELLLVGCEHLHTLPDLIVLKNVEKLELPVRGHCKGLTKLVLSSGDDDYNAEQPSVSDIFPGFTNELSNLILHVGAALESDSHNTDKKMQLKMASMDLRFIKKHEDRFRDSRNCKKAYMTLQNLNNMFDSFGDAFEIDSDKLQQIVRDVVKVKIVIPRVQTECSQSSDTIMKKKESWSLNTNDIVKELVSPKSLQVPMDSLLNSYKSLTDNEKFCLLCFSAFPLHIEEGMRAMFPEMTYLDKRECKKLRFFPCDGEGVWKIDYE